MNVSKYLQEHFSFERMEKLGVMFLRSFTKLSLFFFSLVIKHHIGCTKGDIHDCNHQAPMYHKVFLWLQSSGSYCFSSNSVISLSIPLEIKLKMSCQGKKLQLPPESALETSNFLTLIVLQQSCNSNNPKKHLFHRIQFSICSFYEAELKSKMNEIK